MGKVTRCADALVKYMYLFSSLSAQLLLLILTLLVSVDVIGRATLGKSTQISDEVSGYLLVGIGFLGLAYTLKEGRHVVIELLTSKLSSRRQQQVEVVVYAICIAFSAWLVWATWIPVATTFSTGQHSITPLGTPMWIPYLIVPVGAGMLTLAFLAELIGKVKALKRQ